MIIKAKLRNWKSHLDSEFKFSSGVNALLGIMGSGKSSVMDGISFALFGTFPSLNQRRLKLADMIRSKPSQAKFAEVELEFIGQDGNVYNVMRRVEAKGTANSELRKNGKLIEGPNASRVTEYVSDILRVDYDIFSRAIYSEQNELDYFLNIPRGQRMAKIDQLLRIDRFEKARKSANSLINRIGEELNSKELVAKDLVSEEEETSLKQLKAEKEELEEKAGNLEKELESKKENVELEEGKVSQLEEKADNIKELEVERSSIEGKLSQLRELKTETKGYTPERLDKELEESGKELNVFNSVQDKLDSLETNKASLQATFSTLEEEQDSEKAGLQELGLREVSISELKKGLPELKESEEMKKLRERLSEIEKEHGKFAALNKKSKKLNSELLKLEGKIQACKLKHEHTKRIHGDIKKGQNCPVCRTKLKGSVKTHLLEEHNEKVEALKQEEERLGDELIIKKNELDGLEKILEKINGIKQSIELEERKLSSDLRIVKSKVNKVLDLNERSERVRIDLEKLKTEIARLENEFPGEKLEKIEQDIERLEDVKEALKVKDKLESLEKDLEKIRIEIRKAEFDPEKLASAKEFYKKALLEEEKCKNEFESLRALMEEKEKRFKELDKKRELLEQYKKDIKWLGKAKEDLDLFQIALKKTQESLRAEFIQIVNQVMSEIWSTLYPYGDLETVKLMVEGGDYVLKVRTIAGWVNVEGRASGGERSLACLALRIAFSLALAPNLSWLILDEPTHNLDKESIEELGITLKERLPDLIDQIFLITHEERLESAVSGYLYKLERDKEKDEPTKLVLSSKPEVGM